MMVDQRHLPLPFNLNSQEAFFLPFSSFFLQTLGVPHSH